MLFHCSVLGEGGWYKNYAWAFLLYMQSLQRTYQNKTSFWLLWGLFMDIEEKWANFECILIVITQAMALESILSLKPSGFRFSPPLFTRDSASGAVLDVSTCTPSFDPQSFKISRMSPLHKQENPGRWGKPTLQWLSQDILPGLLQVPHTLC